MNKSRSTNTDILNRYTPQRGSALIYLLAIILIGAAFGAGIVSMTTTSTFTGLSYNPSDQSRFLAKSGLEYARSMIQSDPDNAEEFENWVIYTVDNGQFELKYNDATELITSIGRVFVGTSREASFEIAGMISNDTEDQDDVIDDIINENVFVYGSSLDFSGREVVGHEATIVIREGLDTGDLNRGSHINVSNIYFGGNVSLDGGSASLGSSQEPGIIYVNGNLELWTGGRNIFGDVYVRGNFRLKDARIHDNVYVDGDVELGWTPWLSNDSRIYYTGNIDHPAWYDQTILDKCINVENLNDAPGYDESLEMPDYDIPGPRPDQWYAERGYASSGLLTSDLKIFADSYSSTNWRPTAENVVIVSKGDITITGLGGSGLTGVLYAPYGKVTFGGSFFEGTVIARDGFYVERGGSNVTFINIEDFFPSHDDIPIGP